MDAGIVVAHGANAFRFSHALIREALELELAASASQRLHAQVANALRQRASTGHSDAELAHHFLKAGDLPAAVTHAQRAAERPIAVFAYDEAVLLPEFLRRVPESALPGAWLEMKALKLNPSTRVSAKHKALISLAVASQVPSEACVIAETEFAKLAGATEREIAEAVGMAGITRNMSTQLNGLQVDMRSFVAEIDKLVAGVKSASAKKPAAGQSDKAVATAKTAQ